MLEGIVDVIGNRRFRQRSSRPTKFSGGAKAAGLFASAIRLVEVVRDSLFISMMFLFFWSGVG